MIQRLLSSILKTGIAAINTDPTILDRLFDQCYDMPQAEITAIKTLWVAKPPSVVSGYAHSESEFPLYAITLASESEADHFIGDDTGWDDDVESATFGSDIEGSFWQHTFQVSVYAEHPDAAAWYYEIAKQILLSNQAILNDRGLFDVGLSGAELMPDPRYVPAHLFVRQLTFTCKKEFNVYTGLQARGFTVTGIHVDRGDATLDSVGNVKTNITTYQAGEGDE